YMSQNVNHTPKLTLLRQRRAMAPSSTNRQLQGPCIHPLDDSLIKQRALGNSIRHEHPLRILVIDDYFFPRAKLAQFPLLFPDDRDGALVSGVKSPCDETLPGRDHALS